MDPACGSGIFLRTLLEFQCDPTNDSLPRELVGKPLKTRLGWIETRMLLQLRNYLYHFSPRSNRPIANKPLGISADFFDASAQPEPVHASFDAILINPPFVSIDVQDVDTRTRLAEFPRESGKRTR